MNEFRAVRAFYEYLLSMYRQEVSNSTDSGLQYQNAKNVPLIFTTTHPVRQLRGIELYSAL
jgi:hypothetical protein